MAQRSNRFFKLWKKQILIVLFVLLVWLIISSYDDEMAQKESEMIKTMLIKKSDNTLLETDIIFHKMFRRTISDNIVKEGMRELSLPSKIQEKRTIVNVHWFYYKDRIETFTITKLDTIDVR